MARQRKPASCRYCGQAGLWWLAFPTPNQKDSWRLVMNATDTVASHTLHDCPARKRGMRQPIDPGVVLHGAGNHDKVDPGFDADPAVVHAGNHHEEVQPLIPVVPVVEPAANNAHNAGATLYELVRPHVLTDVAAVAENAAKRAWAGFQADAQPAPINVILPDGQAIIAELASPHFQTAKLITIAALKGNEGNRINVMMVGPAGSGKTRAAGDVAKALNLPFYPFSVGPQTSKSDILGYVDAHGKTVRTLFREAYENGGVFLWDEIDAGHAGVLTIANAATSNGHCSFPDGVVAKHADFINLAAANTYGNGANRQYVGRNQLDAATLDRYVIIDWEYDTAVELARAGVHKDWARFVHKLRIARDTTGVRAIFSTRAIIDGAMLLSAGLSRAEVETLTVWKGLSKDDRAKLSAAMGGV